MWLLILLLLTVTFVICWSLFGYYIFLWIVGIFREKRLIRIPLSLPKVSIVVPCFNEEERILSKLKNIRDIDYPKDLLEVFFIDGGSSDKTVDLLEGAIKDAEPYKVVKSPKKGKIHQLNYILPSLKGDVIINTDVDARLYSDAVKWIVAEFDARDDILVVGAYCRPEDAIEVEKYYWASQNKGRFLESDAVSASVVIAPCYAFRKGLVSEFPKDVVADDAYAAYIAHVKNGIVVYSRRAIAIETRCPQNYEDFIPHKFRKGNAYLRESLRFMYLLPDMDPFCKMMFITKMIQQLLLPASMLFWLMIAGVLLTMFRYDIMTIVCLVLLFLFVLTSAIFATVRLPDGGERYSLITVIRGYIVTILIMLATGATYMFYKQSSAYPRLNNNKHGS